MGAPRKETRYCTFDGCQNVHRVYGLCMAHHLQRLQGRPLTPLRAKKTLYSGCYVKDCKDPHYARGYCQKDYARLMREGLLKPSQRRARLPLADDDVRAIRNLYEAGGSTQKELAEAYGVSTTTVNRIVHRQAWTDVV